MSFLKQAISQKHGPKDTLFLSTKGSIDNPENYRGITLLRLLQFTCISNNRLTSWAASYNVYIEPQAGFRSAMSTSDNIFVQRGKITHMINQGKTTVL